MVIYVNELKTKNFEIDGKMNVIAPKKFGGELSSTSKEIFKIIVGFCLYSGNYEIIGENFHALLDNNQIDFDRRVVKSILELKDKEYIEVSI